MALPGLLPRHLCARLTAGHRASFIAQDCYEESDGGEAWEVVYVPSDVSREQVRVGGNARGTLSVRLEVGAGTRRLSLSLSLCSALVEAVRVTEI